MRGVDDVEARKNLFDHMATEKNLIETSIGQPKTIFVQEDQAERNIFVQDQNQASLI